MTDTSLRKKQKAKKFILERINDKVKGKVRMNE
jgi:hypothetical protein